MHRYVNLYIYIFFYFLLNVSSSTLWFIEYTCYPSKKKRSTIVGVTFLHFIVVFFIENFPIKLILLAYMYLSVIIAEFEQLAFIGPDIVVTPLFAPIFDCICYVITLCTKKKQHTVIEKQNSKYEAFSIESFFSFRRYIVEKKW